MTHTHTQVAWPLLWQRSTLHSSSASSDERPLGFSLRLTESFWPIASAFVPQLSWQSDHYRWPSGLPPSTAGLWLHTSRRSPGPLTRTVALTVSVLRPCHVLPPSVRASSLSIHVHSCVHSHARPASCSSLDRCTSLACPLAFSQSSLRSQRLRWAWPCRLLKIDGPGRTLWLDCWSLRSSTALLRSLACLAHCTRLGSA